MNEEISNHWKRCFDIANDNLKRIADALDLIIRMVKEDQDKTAERYRKYDNEDDMLDDLSKPWKETK